MIILCMGTIETPCGKVLAVTCAGGHSYDFRRLSFFTRMDQFVKWLSGQRCEESSEWFAGEIDRHGVLKVDRLPCGESFDAENQSHGYCISCAAEMHRQLEIENSGGLT